MSAALDGPVIVSGALLMETSTAPGATMGALVPTHRRTGGAAMKSAIDSTEVSIECPQCRQKSAHTLGRLRGQTDVLCPACGRTFAFDGADLDRQLRALTKGMDDLPREISLTLKL